MEKKGFKEVFRIPRVGQANQNNNNKINFKTDNSNRPSSESSQHSSVHSNSNSNSNSNQNQMDQDGMEIKPRKLVNPCKESSSRQDLHRELLFNQKMGLPLLNKKTELEKALEKVKNKSRVEVEPPPPLPGPTNEFNKLLETRAKLIEQNHYFVDGAKCDNNNQIQEENEFVRMKNKILKHNIKK